jgi:type I restriction enzyme S subunit
MRALKELSFSYPESIEEQKIVADLLTSSDHEIAVLENMLDNARDEKSALIQQLLTGRRRVRRTASA